MKSNVLGISLADAIGAALITGCGATSSSATRSSVPQQTQESAPEDGDAGKSAADTPDLTGHTPMIYCGTGMTKPFQEIADNFKAATGCETNVTYANAGQIQSQITTSKEGDMFITGSTKELKPVESYIPESKALVRHMPVLAVQSDNPKNITSLAGLAEEGVSLIIGGIDSTPIGKIAKEALTDAGIFDGVQIEASTATAPQMATTIVTRETDAAIIWKENCDTQGVEIVDNSDLEDYIKTIPTASLSCSADHDARQAFLGCLNSGDVQEIWLKYGYKITE